MVKMLRFEECEVEENLVNGKRVNLDVQHLSVGIVMSNGKVVLANPADRYFN